MIQSQPQTLSQQPTAPTAPTVPASAAAGHRALWIALGAVALLLLGILIFYNLTRWPVTWFDEGSHLHVPKTLVMDGVYADKSSDGYRYFGPTLGVGPTVMLPIALAFKLGGIGLLQARLVMALYLIAALAAFFALARRMGALRFALIAVALLATMRAASTLEYGRQVLGEVPAFFFLVAGLAVWFGGKERASIARLIAAGLLLGLSIVTKSQNLLVIAPALLLAWVANMVYYRSAPQRYFLVTGIVTAVVFAAWQAYQVLYLGPSTWQENFALLRAASAGAAFVFSAALTRASLGQLLSFKVFLGMLPLFLGFGALLALPRSRQGMQWGVIFALVAVNLVWYLFASIGWIRYAFPGLALTTLFAARLFADLFGAVRWEWRAWGSGLWHGKAPTLPVALALLAATGLDFLMLGPLALTAREIVAPPANTSAAMADYLNAHVPQDAVIEAWEPEMGFLTNHNYHFPPSGMLDKSVGYIWRGGAAPSADYHFVQESKPPYVLVGGFGSWVHLYDDVLRSGDYELATAIGGYHLYKRVEQAATPSQTNP